MCACVAFGVSCCVSCLYWQLSCSRPGSCNVVVYHSSARGSLRGVRQSYGQWSSCDLWCLPCRFGKHFHISLRGDTCAERRKDALFKCDVTKTRETMPYPNSLVYFNEGFHVIFQQGTKLHDSMLYTHTHVCNNATFMYSSRFYAAHFACPSFATRI